MLKFQFDRAGFQRGERAQMSTSGLQRRHKNVAKMQICSFGRKAFNDESTLQESQCEDCPRSTDPLIYLFYDALLSF